MNDDELKKLWQQQPLREPVPSAAQLISAMQNKTTLLRRCLDVRDLRELLACAFVIIIFGYFYFTVYREPISRLGDLIIIGSTIFIAWKLVHTRRTTPPAPPGATIIESLGAELNSVCAQSRLLGSVLWWYLLPGFIGLLVATWGLRIDLLYQNLLHAVLYCREMRSSTGSISGHGPSNFFPSKPNWNRCSVQPKRASRWMKRRSLICAQWCSRWRPPTRLNLLEFKVAFWQIALWGEIGIIGIWFFWMLDPTSGNDHWKTKEQAAEAFPQTVLPKKPIAIPSSLERLSICSTQAITPPCKSFTTRR